MTRDEALVEFVQCVREYAHDGGRQSAKEVVVSADVLLAELAKSGSRKYDEADPPIVPGYRNSLDKWMECVRSEYPDHPILADLADLRRKAHLHDTTDKWPRMNPEELADLRRYKRAMETLENAAASISRDGNVWRCAGGYSMSLLALAEKIQGEGKGE